MKIQDVFRKYDGCPPPGQCIGRFEVTKGLNEAKATTNLLKIIRDQGGRRYKIPDEGRRMKPFDVVGVFEGVPVGLEIKVYPNKTICEKKIYEYTNSYLEMHQTTNLYGFQKSHGKSLIAGYAKKNGCFYFYKFNANE